MRKLIIAIAILAAVLAPAALLSSEADADIVDVNIGGNVVLEEDTKYGDGLNVLIDPETTLDLNSHTLEFGKDCKIAILGLVDIKCTTGSLVLGKGTIMFADALVIPALTDDMKIEFDGTISIDRVDKSLVYSFAPTVEGEGITAEHGDIKSVIKGLEADITLSLSDMALKYNIQFDSLERTEPQYNKKGEHVSDRIIIVDGGEGGCCRLDFTIGLTGFDVTDLEVYEVTVKLVTLDSGETNIIKVSEIGPTSIVAKGDIRGVKTHIGEFSIVRTENDKVQESRVFKDIVLEADINLANLIEALNPLGTHGNVLAKLSLTCAEAEIDNGMIKKDLTDIYITLDGSDDAFALKLGFTDGDDVYSVVADGFDIKSISISTDLRISIEIDVAAMDVVHTRSDVKKAEMKFTNLALSVDELRLKALFAIMEDEGSLSPQIILDNCDRLSLTALSALLDFNGDGHNDLSVREFAIVMEEDARKIDTITMSVGVILGSAPLLDGLITLDALDLRLYMEIDGSIAETVDAFLLPHFTEDTYASIEFDTARFLMAYAKDNELIDLNIYRINESSPKVASMTITLAHSMYNETTTLATNVACLGYNLEFFISKPFEATGDTLEMKFKATDANAAITTSFGEEVTFGANIYMPWTLEFDYDDIEAQFEGKDTSIDISHGVIDVKGYDGKTMGILILPVMMRVSDYTISMRPNISIGELNIYVDSWSELRDQFLDWELGIRNFELTLHRGDSRHIGIKEFDLRLAYPDGSTFKRFIPSLDLDTDLSGGEKPKSWVDENAMTLTYVFTAGCVAVLVAILVVGIRKPHLFKFNEGDGEERSSPSLYRRADTGRREPTSRLSLCGMWMRSASHRQGFGSDPASRVRPI